MDTKVISKESLKQWEVNLQKVLDFKNGTGKSGLLITDEFLGLSGMIVEDDPFCKAYHSKCEYCAFRKADHGRSCKDPDSICIQLEDAIDNLHDILLTNKDWKEAIIIVIEKIKVMMDQIRLAATFEFSLPQ